MGREKTDRRLGLTSRNELSERSTDLYEQICRGRNEPQAGEHIVKENRLSELDGVWSERNCHLSPGSKTAGENLCTGGSHMSTRVDDDV